MGRINEELRSAFEAEGYEVTEASDNRGHVRVGLLEEGLDPEPLREIVEDVLEDERMLGWSVEPSYSEGTDGVSTLVTFRRR